MALALETVAEGFGNTVDGSPTLMNGIVATVGILLLWSIFPPLAIVSILYIIFSIGKAAS